jgi:preprotein translocase subunit SecB
MAETENGVQGGNGSAAPADQAKPQFKVQILAQFIRDMSFENIVAQKGIQGEIQNEAQLQVGVEPRKRGDGKHYEVIVKYNLTAKNKNDGQTLFLLELEHAGLFLIEGLEGEALTAFLNIECPRLTYPFARRIISDVTRDGGVQQMNLELIDFVALFRQRVMAQKAAAEQAATAES